MGREPEKVPCRVTLPQASKTSQILRIRAKVVVIRKGEDELRLNSRAGKQLRSSRQTGALGVDAPDRAPVLWAGEGQLGMIVVHGRFRTGLDLWI